MSIPRTTGWGIGLAAATAVISGVSIFVNGLVVKEFADPVALTGARNALVGLVLLAHPARDAAALAEVRALDRAAPAGLARPRGHRRERPVHPVLQRARRRRPGRAPRSSTRPCSSGSPRWRWCSCGESLGLAQVVALVALFGGVLLVGPTGAIGAGPAELMILAATLLWAVEVIVARRLLGERGRQRPARGDLADGARRGRHRRLPRRHRPDRRRSPRSPPSSGRSSPRPGVLLLGYVTTWYAALQRAPASLVTTVLVGGALVTAACRRSATGTSRRRRSRPASCCWPSASGIVAWTAAGRRRPVPSAGSTREASA